MAELQAMAVLDEVQLSPPPTQNPPQWVVGKSLSHGAETHSDMPSVSGFFLHCGKYSSAATAASVFVSTAQQSLLGEASGGPVMD